MMPARRLVVPSFVALVAACTAPGDYAAHDSDDVPAVVREVSRAALRLITFPADRAEIVGPDRLTRFAAMLDQRFTAGTLSARDAIVYEALVEDLRRASAPRNLGPASAGVAFVAVEPTLLVTCRHNLEVFGAPETLVGRRIGIVLIDHRGEIVFDSRPTRTSEPEDAAVVERVGTPKDHALDAFEDDAGRLIASDLAHLRLSRALDIAPLRPAVARASPGQRVYVPHYQPPDGWPHDPRLPCFSRGLVAAVPRSGAIYREQRIHASRTFADHVVYTTCPGGPGLSGAPILDGRGQLVGMVTGGLAETAIGVRGLPGARD